jgi:hypothetical protein
LYFHNLEGRVASRNFLTICLTKILTISARCGLTPQAAEGRVRWVAGHDDHPGPEPTFVVKPCISQISRWPASRRQIFSRRCSVRRCRALYRSGYLAWKSIKSSSAV